MAITFSTEPYVEPYIEPKDCVYRPHHSYVPSYDAPETWSCVCCKIPGDPEKYVEYQAQFKRFQLIEYLWDSVVPSDMIERSDFIGEMFDIMTMEQLQQLLPEPEHWWDY